MIRRAAIIIVAVMLNPLSLRAQDTVFTVDVQSAEVHKGPSVVNPVIGHVARGTVLPVSRNLGSWIKIPWPEGEDGVAYVHITTGHIGTRVAGAPAARTPARSAAGAPPARTIPPSVPASVPAPVELHSPVTTIPASHTFGVGGLVGSVNNFGATARAWHHNRIGVQFGIVRDAFGSDSAVGRVTAVQVEPALVYGLFDHVSDYVWIRPFVGTGLNVDHQTLAASAPAAQPAASDTSVGYRLFGGTELMFASAPRFGVSVDLGYRRLPTPFPGFAPGSLSATVGGHWYVK